MARSKIKPAHHCCSIEKKLLMRELQECDEKYKDHDEHHRCYRLAAVNSGRRSRACMYS